MIMDSDVSCLIDIYKAKHRVPSPLSATVVNEYGGNLTIRSIWSCKDFIKNENPTFAKDYVIAKDDCKVISTGIPTPINDVLLQAISNSGKRQAILREKKTKEDKVFLEIWTESKLEHIYDLTDCKAHGKIIPNESLGCFQWSKDDKFLLYCAEEKVPKPVSFYKDSGKSEEDGKSAKGEEYVYTEIWGDRILFHHPVMCVMDVENGNIDVVTLGEQFPNVTMFQGLWGANDDSIICVGFDEPPIRLGFGACDNRKSALYSVNIKSKEVTRLRPDENVSVRSPRMSPDFSVIVYLEETVGGPHNATKCLKKYNLFTKEITTLVDIVYDPITIDSLEGEKFPGLYTSEIGGFSEDSKSVFLSTMWRSRQVVISVDIGSGKIQKTDDSYPSVIILNVQRDLILARASSPNLEPVLLIGMIKSSGVTWHSGFDSNYVPDPKISWKIVEMNSMLDNKKSVQHQAKDDFEVVLVSPAPPKPDMPLILYPHGGPQSTVAAQYLPRVAVLVELGYHVAIVNYRGSLGFGHNNLMSLLGHVGSNDVDDVHNVMQNLRDHDPTLSVGDIYLYGGSHGGFLAAHLIGQYPDIYKAAVLANPVIDMSSMVTYSDIPDWAYAQSGLGPYDPTKVTTPEQLRILWEKSPIRYAEKVKAPTLLLLGKNDLRVPFAQGIQFYNLLKARKVPVRCCVYEDNHHLLKPEVAGDHFIQTLLWFKQHSSTPPP